MSIAVKIMTWKTYQRKYNPKMYSVQDGVFNKPTTIEPTMLRNGFKVISVPDADFLGKPKDVVLDNTNSISATGVSLIVYHKWIYRDFHDSEISIYYK